MQLDDRPIRHVRHDAVVDVVGGDVVVPVIGRDFPGDGKIALAATRLAPAHPCPPRNAREVRLRILADHLPDVLAGVSNIGDDFVVGKSGQIEAHVTVACRSGIRAWRSSACHRGMPAPTSPSGRAWRERFRP